MTKLCSVGIGIVESMNMALSNNGLNNGSPTGSNSGDKKRNCRFKNFTQSPQRTTASQNFSIEFTDADMETQLTKTPQPNTHLFNNNGVHGIIRSLPVFVHSAFRAHSLIEFSI